MVSLKLLVLLLIYFVVFVSAWKPSPYHIKPFRKLISQALLISSFSTLTNPMTSIAVDQPTVTNNKDIVSLSTFAKDPIAARDHASHLDYDKETLEYYTTGWKKDISYMKAGDDSYKFKAEYRELRFCGFTVACYGLVYRYFKFSSDEYNKQLRKEREQREAAAEKARADIKARWNNAYTQELTPYLILLFCSLFLYIDRLAASPETLGYKVVAWVWKAVLGVLHIQ